MMIRGIFIVGVVFLTTGTIWAEPPNRLDGEVSGLASFYERGEISAPHQLNHPVFRQGYSRLHFKNALGRMGILAAPFSSGFNSTLEFSLRQTRLDDARNSLSMVRLGSSLDVKSFLVNGWYDFKNETPWTPYVGFGLGLTWYRGTLNQLDYAPSGISKDSAMSFAYQSLAGVNYSITEAVNINLGYRYFTTTDDEYGFFTSEVDTHNVELGLHFNF